MVKVRGLGVGPKFLQWTADGRREVEQLSGQKEVPVLLTDEGEAIVESQAIVDWAKAYPRAAQHDAVLSSAIAARAIRRLRPATPARTLAPGALLHSESGQLLPV